MTPLPRYIDTEEELDELMTRPSRELTAMIQRLTSPLVVLGAGGKMGPSLCVRARRAAEAADHRLEVIAVSRFTDRASRDWLEERGIRTISADVLERPEVRRLPDATNVAYLVGLKFGTQQNPARTWAVNTLAPAHVAERYPHARIVALSTGNVYPLVPVDGGGSVEHDPLTPVGEYANAAVARERVFEYFAERQGTSITSIRLNYAVDLRYGVLVDITRRVWTGEPVDVSMGYLNCIWQGDANDLILRSFGLDDPPRAMNLTGEERLSVRELAERSGALLGRPVEIVATEAPTALLSNTDRMRELLGGPPATPISRVLEWTAHWIRHGGLIWGKPSHFEVRDGRY